MCKDRFLFFENYYNIAEKLPDDLRAKFYDALMRYIFRDEEPEDVVVSALITAIKPSLDKEDTRGGYRDGAGRKPNQTQSNEIKNNQKESKIIKINQSESNDNQNNQSFLETGNKKQETGNNIPPKNINSDEFIILSPYKGFEKCSSDCDRRAKFEINGKKFCGQHTRIELTKLGRLDLMPAEKFTKPTLEEIKSYFAEKGYVDESEVFYDFYNSKGWVVGKSPMKDWRAAVRNWGRRNTSNIDEQKEREKLSAAISQHWGDDE